MSVMDSAGAKDFTGEIQDALIQRIGHECFRLWFGQMTECARGKDFVDVFVAAQFALDRIGSRYMKELRQAVEDVCGKGVQARLQLAQKPAEAKPHAGGNRRRSEPRAKQATAATETLPSEVPVANLTSLSVSGLGEQESRPSKKLGWDSIVTGKANKLAVTAAHMVAEQPGSVSPLFVWGPNGVGKTHLLTVLSTDLRARHRLRRVISLTAEEFTNDFLGSLMGSGLPGFRRRYRDVGALIVDEVQFLPGKRATSREMMYTIDAVLKAGKQLIFAADRPPMEIQGLGPELTGRMSSGMVCAMSPLDVVTRTEILRRQSERDGIEIDQDILVRIASSVCGDGRVLSGISCRLKALYAMQDNQVSVQDIDTILADLVTIGKTGCGFSDIQNAVCSTMGLPTDALQRAGQSRSLSQARMLAMYLAREHTGATYGEIGDYFGHRSHSAVIAATRRIANDVKSGKEFAIGKRSIPVKQMLDTVQSLLRSG